VRRRPSPWPPGLLKARSRPSLPRSATLRTAAVPLRQAVRARRQGQEQAPEARPPAPDRSSGAMPAQARRATAQPVGTAGARAGRDTRSGRTRPECPDGRTARPTPPPRSDPTRRRRRPRPRPPLLPRRSSRGGPASRPGRPGSGSSGSGRSPPPLRRRTPSPTPARERLRARRGPRRRRDAGPPRKGRPRSRTAGARRPRAATSTLRPRVRSRGRAPRRCPTRSPASDSHLPRFHALLLSSSRLIARHDRAHSDVLTVDNVEIRVAGESAVVQLDYEASGRGARPTTVRTPGRARCGARR
jgi:hypothetical protein